ncbi:MAG: hypothetical protein ACRYHA_21955 [Janthinobacterium lividum]
MRRAHRRTSRAAAFHDARGKTKYFTGTELLNRRVAHFAHIHRAFPNLASHLVGELKRRIDDDITI